MEGTHAAAALSRRALMGLSHLQQSGNTNDHADEHIHTAHESTLDVRIIAMFAIAAGALLCGLPPLFLRAFQSPDSPVARMARAFSGGIILALALIHIIPEAVTELNEVMDFPIGGTAVLFGILALVIMDSSLTAFWAPEDLKKRIRAELAGGRAARAPPALKPLGGGMGSCRHHGAGGHAASKDADDLKAVVDVDVEAAHNDKHAAHAAAPHAHAHAAAAPGDARAPHASHGEHAHGEHAHSEHAPHTHSCTSSLTAQRWLDSAAAGPLEGVKQRVTAYSMELGCIFHSIIIGVGVGVITEQRQLVIVLMVALIVHQGLEGLSLGTVLALTRFSRAKKVFMVALYSLTTSVGIAVGIAVSATYDPDSTTSKAVQGTLNGVSGGMLLYISMYQLIAEEFSREDLVVKGRLRAGMVGGLLLGAACMCIIAIWS